MLHSFNSSRREFLKFGAAGAFVLAIPKPVRSANSSSLILTAAPTEANLVLEPGISTHVWAYSQQVPGPLLRYKQGDTLKVELVNQLEEPTTIHWHGLRVPIGMDGAPVLSQIAVPPGERFLYEFELLDSGTFWYHPHFNSSKQVGKGLRGVLIVDETDPPDVDRDIVWVLDDWRLNQEAQIALPFQNGRDASHNGRLGNVVTVNGNIEEEFSVTAGERIRLRLVNVANARTFSLVFEELQPWIIALDGHPIVPQQLNNEPVALGAGQRADLIVDIPAEQDKVTSVLDVAYRERFTYELMRLIVDDSRAASRRSNPPRKLIPNPVAKPNLQNAVRQRIVFEGGAMGGMPSATLDGESMGIRELVAHQKFWAVNGIVFRDTESTPPLLNLKLGESYILELENKTVFEHPMHLHGHTFEVIKINDEFLDHPPTRDTTLIAPNETQEIAFVADNPGKWMFHCHVLEHQNSGMMAVFDVS